MRARNQALARTLPREAVSKDYSEISFTIESFYAITM